MSGIAATRGEDDRDSSVDVFEVLSAIILGLGAVGAAWAAYQGDEWGGDATLSYQEANKTSTEASTAMTVGLTVVANDTQLDIQAKQLVFTAGTTQDQALQQRNLIMAKWMYATQLSDAAYLGLGFAPEFRRPDQWSNLPNEAVVQSLYKSLPPQYIATMLQASTQGFENAEKRFQAGLESDEVSGSWAKATVFYAVVLFLAGIGMVFKSRVRWAFAGLSTFGLIGATAFMLTLEMSF